MGIVSPAPHDPSTPNPLALRGIDFVEVSVDEPAQFEPILRAFGFVCVGLDASGSRALWQQNDIRFVVTHAPEGAAAQFRRAHGPSISAMGWRVDDAKTAQAIAVGRGAAAPSTALGALSFAMPAIVGIGDSVIYFVDRYADDDRALDAAFASTGIDDVSGFGFTTVDHLTNNVFRGTLGRWADFYKGVFGFTEVRHFDIRGEHTGLYSYALRSPDGSFCIPINEGTETKSQIEEYLREYRGPGVQHLAFLTDDLVSALDRMEGGAVKFLDIDDDYYDTVFDRVPGVTEDHARIRAHQLLVDGDEHGYLLQIFTKNLLGPIFIELIQRRNHLSFGEGNFGALFRSIERDQQRRGVI